MRFWLKRTFLFSACWASLGLICFQSLPKVAFASGGGDRAGNGGGAAEMNFQFAYLNLAWIYGACLQAPNCLSDGPEKDLLRKIERDLSREQKASPTLIFESGLKNPSRFRLDSYDRLAVTGDHIGDPIYLNLDLLYRPQNNGIPMPADVGMAIGVLTHELGHHQGNYRGQEGERFLDLVGAKVRAQASFAMERVTADNWADIPEHVAAFVEMLAVHSGAAATDTFFDGPQSSLLLSDGSKVFPLDQEILSKLQCPKKDGNSGTLLGYRFHGMKWENWKSADQPGFRRIYPLHTLAMIHCRYPTDSIYPTVYTGLEVLMEFLFAEPTLIDNTRYYRYVEKSLKISLASPKDRK